MDKGLVEDIKEKVPKINRYIARGLVTQQMNWAEHYIQLHLLQAARDFPHQVAFKAIRPCSAEDLFAMLTRTFRNQKRGEYEIGRNSFYLIEIVFEYLGPNGEIPKGEGEELSYKLFVPYIEPNGLFYMRDKAYNFIPVLVDPGFSYTINNDRLGIFVDVFRIRYNFYKTVKHFYADTHTYQKRISANVVYGQLHHASSKKPARLPEPALGVYLFAQFGVHQTFKDLCGADIQVGFDELDQINRRRYVLCTTIEQGTRLRQIPTRMRVAIEKRKFNEKARNLIGTLFYYADHYPDRILPEYLDGTENEQHLWRVLLGKTLKPDVNSELTLDKETVDHINSVRNSITPLVTDEFRERGVKIETMNELFVFVMDKLGSSAMVRSSDIATLYTKKFIGLKNPLNPITEGIYYTLYGLQRQYKDKGELTRDQVSKTIGKNLWPNRITEIIHRDKGHQEIQPAASSSDNRYMGLHCVTITQEEVRKRSKANEGVRLDDPKKFLHASIAEIGSYTNLPKKNPTGRTRINPFVDTDLSGKITRKEKFRELLDAVQRLIDT